MPWFMSSSPIVGYVTDDSAIYQAINGMLSIVIFISSLAVGVQAPA